MFDPDEFGLEPKPEEMPDPNVIDMNSQSPSDILSSAIAMLLNQAQTPLKSAPPARPSPAQKTQGEVPQITAVQARLNLAAYYQALLDQTLFDSVDQYSQAVEREIRTFIEDRLSTLVGLSKPKEIEVKQFTDGEATALKAFAKALLARNAETVVPRTPAHIPAPQVVPVAPQVAPQVVQAQPVDVEQAPQVRKAAVPKKRGRKPALGHNPLPEPVAATPVVPTVINVPVQPIEKPIPMPMGRQFEAISAAKAAETAQQAVAIQLEKETNHSKYALNEKQAKQELAAMYGSNA